MGYENGEYVIQVDEVDYSLWANPGQTFGDVFVGVTMHDWPRTARQPTWARSAVIRMRATSSTAKSRPMVFTVSRQVKNGDLSVLTGGGKLQSSDVIRKDTRTNQLQFLCAGNRFALLVNDQFVDAIQADVPASGDVGLIAGTFDKAGARVRFDDFSAVLPPPGTEVGSLLSPGDKVLFADDFSDPKSGWDVRETANGASGYQDGRYFIRVEKPKFQLWSSPGQSFEGDVIVEVTAGLASGPQENEMGVICRYQDRQNFVYGSIGTDGYYAIVEIKNDKTTVLTGGGKFQKSDAIPSRQ